MNINALDVHEILSALALIQRRTMTRLPQRSVCRAKHEVGWDGRACFHRHRRLRRRHHHHHCCHLLFLSATYSIPTNCHHYCHKLLLLLLWQMGMNVFLRVARTHVNAWMSVFLRVVGCFEIIFFVQTCLNPNFLNEKIRQNIHTITICSNLLWACPVFAKFGSVYSTLAKLVNVRHR